MGSLGPTELIIIFGLILLLFGAKRIPEIARGLGKGIREFKSATNEISRELTLDDRRHRIQPPPQPPASYSAPAQTHQQQAAPPAQGAEGTAPQQ